MTSLGGCFKITGAENSAVVRNTSECARKSGNTRLAANNISRACVQMNRNKCVVHKYTHVILKVLGEK